MKITFLGTGTSQGIPVIGSKHPVCLSKNSKDKRLRSSILIEKEKKIFLIDCGPDFRYQMLRSNHEKLNAIFITHEHQDHIGGLDDIRSINLNMNQSIPIYGLRRVIENLKKRFFYIFSKNKKSNISVITVHELDDCKKFFFVENSKIFPLSIWHDYLPILGFRIENFAYITDASRIPIQTIQKLKGINILVLNVLRKVPKNPFSIILDDTLNIIREICPQKTYLTHISHTFGFHEKIEPQLPKNVYLAYDKLILNL
ncbi:MBL fold metallo-hydrolase [Blattabacterium sp. (Blaberus giganteus)]|uniref:MBL fold metallo-hydrolase n=1 Tax=Blattabacterium sp. (Blaberus giganteus) TaxID=1186051 RepID=UPI00025F7076|nr:MBL fold metallo-hydrolase [Blattabacterium sp. (Blaberus giganteus)]AFJ90496.1 metallo-beta-lactamase domain protein [Blattabacterium sp. (Blaberus giganteus)]